MRRERNIPARSTPPSGDSPEDSASAADRVTTGYCGAISASLPLHAAQRFPDLAAFTWTMRLFWSPLARGKPVTNTRLLWPLSTFGIGFYLER